MSLNIVQGEDRAVAGRQLTDSLIKRNAIHYRHRIGILRAFDYLYRRFAIIRGLLHLDATLAKVHQDLVDSQSVQPGGKGRLTTKASYFSKELYEDFLSEVFGLRNVAGHSQTQRINPAIMPLVKLLEGRHIALGSFLRQSVIRFLGRLDFDCGHVFVFGASYENSILNAVRPGVSRVRIFKGARPFSSAFSTRFMRGYAIVLNAGVMQRLKRVVALPDPKDIEFPQPQQHFPETPGYVQ